MKCKVKPIFHCDAKYLASGVGIGQCPRSQNFALEIPTWYLGANAKCKICVTPNAKCKICVTPDANPRRQSVEYRGRWVPNARFSRWPCTFHVVYVNFICVGHPTQTSFFSGIWALVDIPALVHKFSELLLACI